MQKAKRAISQKASNQIIGMQNTQQITMGIQMQSDMDRDGADSIMQ